MNKKFDISNIRYELISSSDPKLKEVQVLFNYQGRTEKYFIFIENKGKKNYIREAKRIFKRDLNEGKVIQALKTAAKGKHIPLLIISIAVVAAAAIGVAGYFTYKYLNNSQPEPAPTPKVNFTVSFDANGGEVTSDNPVIVEPLGTIKNKPTLADRGGYKKENVKWLMKDGTEFVFDDGTGTPTKVNENLILKANWGDIKQSVVTFYDDEGNKYDSLSDIKVDYGQKIQREVCPTSDKYDSHYTFIDWYDDKPSNPNAQPFNFNAPIDDNSPATIKIYAKHKPIQYYVTFNPNGGELIHGGDPIYVDYNDSIPAGKRPAVVRSGYGSTLSWTTDAAGEHAFVFEAQGIDGTPVTDNMTLYAKWGEPADPIILTLNAGSGTFADGSSTLEYMAPYGVTVAQALAICEDIPTLADNTFAYYEYENGDPIGYNDVVVEDCGLNAGYLPITEPLDNLDQEYLSWETIKKIAVTNNDISTCFNLGATKSIENIYEDTDVVRIIGFNDDRDSDDNFVGITFEYTNSRFSSTWNEEAEPSVGNHNFIWCSDINRFTLETVWWEMPEDLKECVSTVVKDVEVDYDGVWKDTDYNTQLFILSKAEMEDGPECYDIYVNDIEQRRKGCQYWLRSPNIDTDDRAWRINSEYIYFESGVVNEGSVYNIFPAFCI